MESLKEKMAKERAAAEQEGYAPKGGSDWFKFTEGVNRFRVMSEFEVIFESYQDGICFTDCGFEGSPKFMCYVLDMNEVGINGEKEPKIKIAKFPAKIADYIANLQEDEDYSYDSLPLPYDMKINAENAGTKEVIYTPTPAPASPLDAKYVEELKELTPIPEIIEKMKAKNATKHGKTLPGTEAPEDKKSNYEYPESDIKPEDVPF